MEDNVDGHELVIHVGAEMLLSKCWRQEVDN